MMDAIHNVKIRLVMKVANVMDFICLGWIMVVQLNVGINW